MFKYSISIFLWFLIFSQCAASRYQLEKFINSLDEQSSEEDDPNDRVDIDRWNELNEWDIDNMPEFDDYSDENNALEWLAWYSRVALRYYQVKALIPKNVFVFSV